MKALVFDQQSDAQSFWQRICNEFGMELECWSEWSDSVFANSANASICIIDQSTIGNSLHAAMQICRLASKSTLVFTGSELSVPLTVQLMSQGATWVFRKAFEADVVRAGFPCIVQAAEKLEHELREHERLQALFQHVSERERSVLELVLNGVPNKQIAKELQVSVRTVEARRAKIYRKCEVQSVTELVRRVDHAKALTNRFGELQLKSKRSSRHNLRQVGFHPTTRAS